jgi:hypothetical protein
VADLHCARVIRNHAGREVGQMVSTLDTLLKGAGH